MKIGLTGPHSSGKTTLLNALHNVPEFKDIDFLPEITRQIKERGFDINEAGTVDTQVLIMAAHMNNLLLHNRFIVDRSLMDGLVYTLYLHRHTDGSIPKWFVDYSQKLFDEYINRYSVIFYLPPEIPLADDGVRSVAKGFHEHVCSIFDEYITKTKKQYPSLIVTVSGSVEERVAIVRKTLLALKGE